MTTSNDTTLDLRHYLRILWRRRGVIILCAVSTVCAAVIALSFLSPEYTSSVTLLIQDPQPLTRDLEQIMGRVDRRARYNEDNVRMSQLAGRVRSRPFLERVILLLRMHDDPVVRAEARERIMQHPDVGEEEMAIRILVDRLLPRLSFSIIGPGLYAVHVVGYSPENAQRLAKWISELFVTVTTQNVVQQMRTARDFGAEQQRLYERELKNSEDALEAYKSGVIERGLDTGEVRADNLLIAETLLRRVRSEAESAEDRAVTFLRRTAGVGEETVASLRAPVFERQARRLTTELQRAIDDRLARPVDDGPWPPQGSYAVLRRDLFRRLEAHVDSVAPRADVKERTGLVQYRFAEIDAQIYSEAVGYIESEIMGFRRQAQGRPVDELELAKLEKEVEKNRQLLETFRSQMVASDIRQAVERTELGEKVEILNPAELPLAPSRPNRIKILLAAILMGPAIGAVAAFLFEAVDPTLRSLRDFERLVPEPILSTAPRISKLKLRRRRLRRHWVPATLAGVLLLTVVFFVFRNSVLQDAVAPSKPVYLVDPEEANAP